MNSREKNARIVWRMKSVEATRVMPSRWATSAATVDLPVPVEPPISTMIGTSSVCRSASRCSCATARSPSSSPSVLARERRAAARGRPCAHRARRDRPRPVARAGTRGRPGRRPRSARAPSAPSSTEGPRRRAAAARRAGAALTVRPSPERATASASSTPSPTTLVRGEHDALAARERMLGDDVDRRRLHLDQVRVGVETLELAAQRRAVGEVRRDVHDIGVEMGRRRSRPR